jgi:hypothetical protein
MLVEYAVTDGAGNAPPRLILQLIVACEEGETLCEPRPAFDVESFTCSRAGVCYSGVNNVRFKTTRFSCSLCLFVFVLK